MRSPSAAARVGRADDVGGHHGREYAIRFWSVARTGHELLDLIHHRVLLADPGKMIIAQVFDILGAENALGHQARTHPSWCRYRVRSEVAISAALIEGSKA